MPRVRDISPLSDLKGLLAVLLAILLGAFLTSGHHPCQNESIRILTHIIPLLGNSSDAKLYTPEDFTVRIFYRCYILESCYAKNLGCFLLELNVTWKEEEEHRAVLERLISRLEKLQPQKNCADPHAQCPPCECHPEQPLPAFLHRLLQLLQWSCKTWTLPCVAKERGTC